jgi:hypothetical protein
MYQEKEIVGKIIGKTEEVVGLIFHKKVYKVAILLDNKIATTREVPFHQYCLLHIGKEYYFTMYSYSGDVWFFSPEK